MRMCALLLLLLPIALYAQADEGNLIKNPGFEEPAAANAYLGWSFVNHDQDFIRGEIQALDYHAGLNAASIKVGAQPKVYACWAQHVPVAQDDLLPDTVSLWYRAPDAPAQLVISFIGIVDGKGVAKGGVSFPLEKSRDWRQVTFQLDSPTGTRDLQVELRVDKQGEYRFDDVVLVRKQQAAATGKPHRLLFVGIGRSDLNEVWKQELATAGWQTLSFEEWDNLSPGLLKQCRAVFLARLPFRSYVTDADRAIADMIVDYANAGGGVLLTQNSAQIITDMTLYNHLAERFGMQILFEKTTSDPALTRHIGSWGSDVFTYTDRVSAPLNEGVTGLLYQSAVDMGSLAGVLPMLPGEGWQVVLTAGPESKSEPTLLGLEEVDAKSRPEGYTTEVPLAGVRQVGKGRVAFIGQRPDVIFWRAVKTDEDRQIQEEYLRKDYEGKPNGLLRFYLNAFTWLSGGSEALETAQLTLREVKPPAFTTEYKLHRGIIGPRTTYSTGSSTPAQYVEQARAGGFDFIVFLEEMAKLKPGGFEQLKADCRKLSTADFLAVPGVTYQNTDGNNEYVFGEAVRLPSNLFLDDQSRLRVYPRGPDKEAVCGEQTWLYQLLGFENVAGWYLFGKNPYPHYDARDVNAMAVVTQEGGKTLERLVDAYGQESRLGQLMWPQALTLMKSADEMAQVKSGVYYHNVVGADGTKMLNTLLNTLAGRGGRNLYPGLPCFGATSITNGPNIELYMPRGDTDAQGTPYNPALQEWPLDLKASSPAGLKQIVIMDGDTPVRNFLPGGKQSFSFQTVLPKERQKYLWVRAVDVRGKEAISRDVQCDSWLLRDQQCADRNNQLLYSSQRRPDGSEYFVSYGADTCLPDKGPWNGRVRPVGTFVFDSKLGSGGMSYDGSPENHPQLSFNPYVIYDGKVPDMVGWSRQVIAGVEGAPHVQPYRVISSSEALIGDRILDGVFPLEAKPVIHVWHTLYPVQPSQYLRTRARCSMYLPKVDGVAMYVWRQEFTPLKDIPVKEDSPFTFGLGVIGGWLGKTDQSTRLIVSGGQTESAPLAAHGMKTYAFKRGDCVGILHSIFGSLAVYSLSDNLVLWGDGINYQVGIKCPAGVVKADTKREAGMLLVGINRLEPDPEKLALKLAQDYGLTGTAAYQVQPGVPAPPQAVTAPFEARLHTGEAPHGFVGKVIGLTALPGNLPAIIGPLNDNWSAVLQLQDGSGKTRIIPVEQGSGYVTLRAEDESKPLFIGHPLIATDEKVIISLARTKDWKTWQVEIHNPTDQPLSVRVMANPAVHGFKLDETVRLPAGSSVIRTAGAAPAG